jgi:type I restriction enzyme M protein
MERVCSKVFDNRECGHLKLTIERPLRLHFQASAKRMVRLKDQTTFANLAESKERKDKRAIAKEETGGRKAQEEIIASFARLDAKKLYKNRDAFEADRARR